MSLNKDSNIGKLVADNYKAANIFNQFGIDFCCNGNRSIQDACEAKGIDSTAVIGALEKALEQPTEGMPDFKSWPVDLLIDYIEKKHHRYVTTKIEEIKPLLHKIVKVHGSQHPELASIEELFIGAAQNLTAHMKKEELILFPFIRKIKDAESSGTTPDQPHFGRVENPIAMMHDEHDTEGERFRQISTLANNYTPPADACNTYRVTFALLKEFEEDLHLHIHLENNIVFPKAVEMQARMMQTA